MPMPDAPSPTAARAARAAGLLLLGLALAVALPARRVASDEMAASLRAGELVWVLPVRPRKADVVAIADPLDPARTVLRRVVAGPGEEVRFDEGGLRVNAKRVRPTEMGEQDGHQVVQEVIWSRPPARANNYLTRLRPKPQTWSSPGTVEVPEGHWYLLADDRDGALDSRWWGPVPDAAVKGVVRARLGEADAWRPAVELLLPEE
jgi:signal peptidase I